MTAVLVTIGGVTMNTGTPDGNGTLWYVTGLQGWDAPPHVLSTLKLPGQHGEITTQNTYGARQITLAGIAKCTTEANFYTSRYAFEAATAVLSRFAPVPLTLTVTEGSIARFVTVLRTGLQYAQVGKNAFEFELNLRADDPTKYTGGAAQTLTTSGTATNAGSASVYPTFTLTSTGTPVITRGAYTLTATQSLPAGTVIDMGARTVLNGSTNYFGRISPSSNWIVFSPGANAVTSTVAGTWSWRDGWV